MIRSYFSPAMFGVLAGIDGLGTSIAFAALIFSGPQAAGLAAGVSVMLVSCVILTLYVAWRSCHASSVAQVQETTIAILAAAVTAAVGSMSGGSADRAVATTFAILGVSTVATGVLFYALGRFRLGVLVRFMPYSVIAGFLAGSGWLLVDGALMMISAHSNLADILLSFSDPLVIGILVPAILFAGVMSAALRLINSPFAAPVVMVLSVGLFYLVIAVAGIPLETVRSWRWLPEAASGGGFQLPSPLTVMTHADWSAVLSVTPVLVSVPLIAMAGLLLNISGLEVAAGTEIDANRELKIAGQANLVTGLFGGAAGFTGLGMTLLADRLRVQGRTAGLATGLVMALALPFATELAAGVPLFLAAGLMLMLGGELIHDWAVVTCRKLPPLEWAIVLVIVASIMAFGFLSGMAVGLVFAIATFVYTYARLPVIRFSASGRDRRSSTDRFPAANHLLAEKGELIRAIELQGYLFFGTMEQVVRAVQRLLAAETAPRFLILDLRNVSGMDSAAVAGFTKIANMARRQDVALILSPAMPLVLQVQQQVDMSGDDQSPVNLAPDLDHALENAEDRLLQQFGCVDEPGDIAAQLVERLGFHPRLPDLIRTMERLERPPGARLMAAGEQADDVFLLGAGRVRVQLTLSNGRSLRLRSMTAGAVLGEVAFYVGGMRTADVIVEERATLFRLAGDTVRRLEREDPTLATLVHRLLASSLAERLALANRMVQLASG
ncbi:SulP family inorganic anion transporter [Rhizobium straminoryzae]|nr:SulP family inorganic anion transporter [Rhizobium straminoryzae]